MKETLKKYVMPVFLFFITIFFSVGDGNGHPHAFIAQRLKCVFDDKGLSGFQVSWHFDEMFSAMIASDFDSDQDGRLDKKEVQIIREKAFANIAHYNYYTHVRIDGKPFSVKFVKHFKAVLEKGILKYTFFIPCHVRAVKTVKKIIVSPYDPEYYSAIYFHDNQPWSLENSDAFEIDATVKTDTSTSIYYDMVNPWALFLTFKLKS